jgi:hypothetical protein
MAKLTAFLSLNAKAFTQALKSSQSSVRKLEGQMQASSGRMSSVFSSIGRAAKVGLATVGANAAAAFTAVAASMKTALDEGGHISDVMAQTGASGRNLVILEQAFKNAGVEAGKVPRALGKMQKTIVSATEGGEAAATTFNKLGVSAGELVKMDAVQAFRVLSEAISHLPTPTQRAAAAMEVFGRSGADLMAVIDDPGAWQSAVEYAGGYADIIGENAARFDAVSDAAGNFGIIMKQIGAIAAEAMLPHLERMMDLLPELARGLNLIDWSNPFSSDLTAKDREAAKRQADQWAQDDPMHGKSRREEDQKALARQNAEFWARKEAEKQEAIAKAAEKARIEAEKKAEADRKKAEEVAKTRAEALDAYKLEAQIIQARIEGNDEALARLEREKRIREEMAGLVQAGFTQEEARKGATLMVDKQAAAEAAEKARRDGIQSNASQLGAFAQSMNVLFGRSANAGLLEENKRQTDYLRKIHERQMKPGQKQPPPDVVFA